MNCTDVASILDDHRQARLTAAERCALDEHVSGCEPCAHAWYAQSALLALPLPATPADLLARALRAAQVRSTRTPQRVRARIVIVGALLAAGAALAVVTTVRLLDWTGDRPVALSTGSGAPESAESPTSAPQIIGPTSAASAGASAPVAIDEVQSDYVMIIRVAPEYPREALARKLDGDVTLAYTIDKRGSVKNVRSVRSSDPQFEGPAIAALSQFKYLPRVAGGKRVDVDNVQTVFGFTLDAPLSTSPPAGTKSGEVRQSQLSGSPTPSPSAKPDDGAPRPPSHPADYETFDHASAVAWQRAADEDFRGAELELDELRATYDLDDRQSNQVWGFFGYIYTQYGDYGRAIDAYEKAIAIRNFNWPGQWTSLASLYFARHQYDKALETLLVYNERSPRGIAPEAKAMIERLRALGVTEETLTVR